ncbi:MAG: LemA family protein [Candidatus Binataceae bacterium]
MYAARIPSCAASSGNSNARCSLPYARQAYNDVVLSLNTRVETFPSNLIANNFGFHAAEYFKGAPEDQAVPKVDLSMSSPSAPSTPGAPSAPSA